VSQIPTLIYRNKINKNGLKFNSIGEDIDTNIEYRSEGESPQSFKRNGHRKMDSSSSGRGNNNRVNIIEVMLKKHHFKLRARQS
jgi:hypothetical protein